MKLSRKRIVRLLIFALASLCLLLYFGYPIGYAYHASRPARYLLPAYSPAVFGKEFETIHLTTTDGLELAGWYIPSQNQAAVILLHGYGGSRVSMLPHAEILARHGYGVLLYDMRASGESPGARRSFGWRDVKDVDAALAYLRDRPELDPTKTGIAGVSTGAEVALAAAAQTTSLAAVLADGPGFPTLDDIPPPATFEDWYMKPLSPIMFHTLAWFSGEQPPQPLGEAIPRIAPRPLLLVSAGTGLELRQAQMYLALAGEPKTHWNLPDAPHGGGLDRHPADYEQKMMAFFNQALLYKE